MLTLQSLNVFYKFCGFLSFDFFSQAIVLLILKLRNTIIFDPYLPCVTPLYPGTPTPPF